MSSVLMPGRQLLPVATGRQMRHDLRVVLRGRWWALGAALAVLLADSALALAGPVAIGRVAQAIADHRGTGAVVIPVVVLGAASLAAGVTGWASTVLLARVVLPAAATLRERALASAVRLPIDTVEAGGGGDLVSRVSGDVERVSEAAESALGVFLAAALTILATLVGLAGLDWRFALAGLLAVPIQAWTLRWYLRTSRPIYAGGRIAEGRRTSALLVGFTALPTLRALRLGRAQRERIAAASADALDYELRSVRTATRFYGRLNVAELIGLGAILLVAFVLVRHDLADVGAATTAALFFAGLFNPINTVLGVFDTIQQATAGLARLIGIGAAEPPASAPRPLPAGPLTLDVEQVRFGYPDGPDVLHDVSLTAGPGRRVAVVGATGSGKSTLASLLAGLRAPRHGAVRLGGVPTAELERATIALVTQETHVFAGTVADNLRIAAPGASAAELQAALETVGAGWVDVLPDGLDTSIGSGGAALTVSQTQQLALARLLLLDPVVVVLDEATAEGGSDAARTLDRAATAVTTGRTAVTIAHRLSQTADADEIVVVDAGRVVEHGTHEQLVASGGAYAELWAAWSR